jgi:predicted alpha/beta-fold hydrolase
MDTSDYRVPGWLRNAHLQSALGALPVRRAAGLRALALTGAITRNHTVDAGEGVRLLGSHSAVPDRDPLGLVLLLHGWEGSSESSYMCHTSACLLAAGFDVFRLNFRDHGDSHHLNEGLFHSCRLAEVVQAAKWVAETFPAPNFLAAGYSLGGNFALRLALVAPEAGIALVHAAVVCPAVDPAAIMDALEAGRLPYHWYFMRKWRASLKKKRRLFPLQHGFDDAVLAQDMRGLTQWLVQRHTDLSDIEDYFNGYSLAGGRLGSLQVPVSVLAAADDPLIPIDTLRALRLPAHSYLEIARYGGHCAFIEDVRRSSYAERWVAAKLKAAVIGVVGAA